jgi:hypothetical protein
MGLEQRLFSLVICKRSEPLFKQIGLAQTSIQVVQFVVQNEHHHLGNSPGKCPHFLADCTGKLWGIPFRQGDKVQRYAQSQARENGSDGQ